MGAPCRGSKYERGQRGWRQEVEKGRAARCEIAEGSEKRAGGRLLLGRSQDEAIGTHWAVFWGSAAEIIDGANKSCPL